MPPDSRKPLFVAPKPPKYPRVIHRLICNARTLSASTIPATAKVIPMRHVFVDESCQNDHHYMVLGALSVPGELVAQLEDELGGELAAHRLGESEVKWTKIRNANSIGYRAFVDKHFDVLCARGVEFHALVIDNFALDNRCYNQGDADLAYAKFLHSLLLYRVGLRFPADAIVVDLDARNTTRDPEELRRILNYGMRRRLGVSDEPFRRIAHRDSRGSRLLQLSDLLAGAVAWHKNDHDARGNAAASKVDFANYIAGRVGLRRLGADSPRREIRLNVWNHTLGRRGAR